MYYRVIEYSPWHDAEQHTDFLTRDEAERWLKRLDLHPSCDVHIIEMQGEPEALEEFLPW